jgi:signal peptidase complex subunit 2
VCGCRTVPVRPRARPALPAAYVKTTVLGDTATMKRLLDDHVAEVFQGELRYEEDVALSNIKLIVGFAGVGAALVSHVYPKPFPHNWWVLLACCAWYFAMSGILQFLLSYVELEAFLQLKPHTKGGAGRNIASSLPRFSDKFSLAITPLPHGSLSMWSAPKFRHKPGGEPGVHAAEVSVTKFFDEDGAFAEEAFGRWVRAFAHEFEALEAKGGLKVE